ncbi:SigE family RNA polymerase sigma factor [uncultured Jatrophihabitans sp.]|uniref:SigE family RNA polymerase sigma factor n=1 Tax=uncultured Jatrophihabitans sp. TaxID=1610747 RepID=UPI0035C96B77
MTFEEFVDARVRTLIGFAIAMTGDKFLSEDLVQDVLIKAHQRWEHVSALDDPHSYVRRMLVNEYVSWRRKWSRLIPVPDVTQAVQPDPAVQYVDRAALAAQLATLTRTQRAVLALRFFADLPDDEIARALGCSISTVRSHASRALAALRTDPEALMPSQNRETS